MLRLLKNTGVLKNSGRILANNLPSTTAAANYASMPEPKTNPEILYTGVSFLGNKYCVIADKNSNN